MPATGQVDPTSLRSAIRLYLLTHPGPQRGVTIADGLKIVGTPDRQKLARELQRMTRRNEVTRETIPNPDAGRFGQRPTTSAFTLATGEATP